MAQKGLCNVARERMLRNRGVLSKEEGDLLRKYKATHEENLLSSWLEAECGKHRRKNEGHGQEGQRGGKQKW